LAAAGKMAFVPDRQDRGDHRPRVLTDLLEVQPVDLTDQLDQVHVQVDGIVGATPQFEIREGVALRQFERQQ